MKLLCKIFGHKLIEILKDQERFWDGEQYVDCFKVWDVCSRCGHNDSGPFYHHVYSPLRVRVLEEELERIEDQLRKSKEPPR